jgi:2-C-methyl-D-erythritol 4-phosphate cytidylyltransferase
MLALSPRYAEASSAILHRKSADKQYDSPLNLFDRSDSIFRSLCNVKKLSREDIVMIRDGARVQ